MHKYLWPIGGLMVTVLAGIATMVGPFALHLSHGGHWTLATEVMFWSGVGVIVVALGAMGLWQRDLMATVGEMQHRLAPPAPVEEKSPEATQAPSDEPAVAEWDTELERLAHAVLEDLKTEASIPKTQSPVSEDLQAVASALLRDLNQRMEPVNTEASRGGRYQ